MTYPFYMSVKDIGKLNFKQINALLEEHAYQIGEKEKRIKRMLKVNKNTQLVLDIMRLDQ